MELLDSHLLDAMLLVPVAGALLCMTFPSAGDSGVRALGLCTALVEVALAAACWQRFEPGAAGWQLAVEFPWLPAYGVTFRLGLDGLALALVALTTALVPPVILHTFTPQLRRPRDAMICVLLLEASMLGAVMATDLFLFYVFFEAMLLPALFLVVMWGGPRAPQAVLRFVLTTLMGSLLMLVGLLCTARAAAHLGPLTFAAEVVQARLAEVTLDGADTWMFGALMLGFGIKAALFPLHGWLAGLYEESPPWCTALVAGVMGKLGAFAWVRYGLGLYPQVAVRALPYLTSLALVGVIYAASLAIAERHLHRRLAFASMSHMGLMLVGLCAMSPLSVTGAGFEMVAHGVSIAALFLLAAALGERGVPMRLGDAGGLARHMPVTAVLFVTATMAFVGLPGMGGFVGEFLIFTGTFEASRMGLPLSVGDVAEGGVVAMRAIVGIMSLGAIVQLVRSRRAVSPPNRTLGVVVVALLALLLVAPPAWGRGGLLVRLVAPALGQDAPFHELLALLAGLAVLSTVLASVSMLTAVGKLFFGAPHHPEGLRAEDVSLRERLTVAPLVVATAVLGLAPQPLIDRLEPTARALVSRLAAG